MLLSGFGRGVLEYCLDVPIFHVTSTIVEAIFFYPCDLSSAGNQIIHAGSCIFKLFLSGSPEYGAKLATELELWLSNGIQKGKQKRGINICQQIKSHQIKLIQNFMAA